MVTTAPLDWKCTDRQYDCRSRALVLGILNVTPDSFSDGGQFFDPVYAVERGLQMIAEGADILDIGGESTRPGADPVSLEDELSRVIPIVRELAKRTSVMISVDTSKAEVARQSLDCGAKIINDVTGLCGDPAMVSVVAKYRAGAIVMHMQGTPTTMQANPTYANVVDDVATFFATRLRYLIDAGIDPDSIAIDPGIGFGKTQEHNLTLLANLERVNAVGRPLCLGVSRKGFMGIITGRNRAERLAGSLAVACFSLAHGSSHILRVHDVAATVDAVKLSAAIDAFREN